MADEELIIKYLKYVKKGEYPANIAEKLKKNPSVVSRALRRLEQKGYLKRTIPYPAFYDLTPKGKVTLLRRNSAIMSLPVNNSTIPFFKGKVSFHDFKVKLPILEHGQIPKGAKSVPINGWIKRYYHLELPVRLTLELTTRSAILHFEEVNLPRNSQFYTHLYRWYILGTFGAINYLKKYNYSVDVFAASVISQHIANRTGKAVDAAIPAHAVTSLGLGRKAYTPLGEVQREAVAHIDKSEGNTTHVESNDLTYEEKVLRMPESIDDMKGREAAFMDAIGIYTTQVKRHLAVMDKIERSIAHLDKTMAILRRKGRV
jgi:DNA-binding Lrp family transcriptional regulator